MLRLLRSRLAVRLAALFLLVSLAPIGGAAWFMARAYERSARAEVERRHRLLAERCAALVEEHVEGAREKLRTVGRLFARELGSVESERLAAPFALERDELVRRLQELVDPPDAFLELQFFAGGLNPQIVGQARQKVFDEAQQMLPDYFLRNTAQINSNLAAPLVQAPLNSRQEWRDEKLVTIEGYRTLLVSVPVSQPAATGALVAYVDFAPLAAQLAALAGAEYALDVRDQHGTLLGAVGSIGGPALAHLVPAAGWSIRVLESAGPLAASLGRFRRQTWLFAGLTAAAALAVSLALSAWITRPVARLERAAGELQRGNFAAEVRMDRADEIGRLGAAFDRMAGVLRELDQAKSEFVANVSHELRTPLTSMKLSVANLLDGVVGDVDPGQRAALLRIQGELERLIRLVNQLLEMARLDAGAVEPRFERVELLELAREVVESLRPLAGERSVELSVEGEGVARADRGMLQRVLLNLLDNAIKFSPAGSRVLVQLAGSSFQVRDSGPGIATSFAFPLVAWILGRGGRARAAWTALALFAVQCAFLVLAGFGTRSLFYSTPWSDPGRFLANAGLLASGGVLALLGPVPLDLVTLFPAAAPVLVGLGAVVGWPLVAWILRRAPAGRARGLALAWTLSFLLPQGGAAPADRLLFVPSIGAAAVLALAWSAERARWAELARPRRLGTLLLALSVTLGSGLYLVFQNAGILPGMAGHVRAKALATDIGPPTGGRREVLVLQSESHMQAFTLGATWHAEIEDESVRFSVVQSGPRAVRWTRTGEREFELESLGRPFLDGPFERVYLSDPAPPSAGTRWRTPLLEVEARAVDARGLRAIRVTLDRSLDDPSLRFVRPLEGVLTRIDPPAIGGSLEIPEALPTRPFVP